MAEVIQEKHIEPRKFTIRVVYFKDNGKYYTEDEYEWKGRIVGDAHPTVYMPDVVAQVRGVAGQRRPGGLAWVERRDERVGRLHHRGL